MADGLGVPHSLSLTERKKLTMTGAQEVVSFDESCVVMKTTLGTLMVQGQQLQLKQLTLEGGNVAVEGEMASKEGWWVGLFLDRTGTGLVYLV